MDRVQYHLERLLPTLQLLSTLTLFSSIELQSLTHTRRQHETALITPASSPATFLQYVAFELDVEKLLLLRISRAGKDPETGDDRVTLKDRSNLRRATEKHIISIWQRLIAKKGRKEPRVYSLYLDFLQQRKMRRIYGQVAAQALSMHPTEGALWIRVADWELNDNTDAGAARITLLRAIRLNTSTNIMQMKPQRPTISKSRSNRKRMRLTDGSVSTEVQADDEDQNPRVNLSLQSSSTSVHRNVVDLWIQYFKMELVFMERLRRRWVVLGIGATSDREDDTQQPAKGNDDELQEEEEEGAAGEVDTLSLQKVRQGDAEDDAKAAQDVLAATDTTAPIKVLSGALPLAIFSSALALNAKAQDHQASRFNVGPSLPAEMRLAFIIAVTEEVQRFPFVSFSEESSNKDEDRNDGEELRASLLKNMASFASVLAADSSENARTLALATHSASLRSLIYQLNRTSRTEARLFLSEEERREESRKELAAAAELRPIDQTSLISLSPRIKHMGEAAGLLQDFLELTSSADGTTREVRRTQKHLLLECLTLLRSLLNKSSEAASPGRLQLLIAKQIKIVLDDMRGSSVKGIALLRMTLTWGFWRVYAYLPHESEMLDVEDEESASSFSPFEIGLGAQAHDDPLLPYLASSIRRSDENMAGLSQSESDEARLLKLVFEYQVTLHDQALAQEGEEDKVTKRWQDLLNLIAEEKAKVVSTKASALERCLIHLQARVWSSACAWNTLLYDDSSTGEDQHSMTMGTSFWSSLLNLSSTTWVPMKTSASPYLNVARRTYRLFFLWCLSLPPSKSISLELGRLLENAVRLTRLPLLSSSSPTLEERGRDQELHDEALYVYSVKCNGLEQGRNGCAGQIKMLTDTSRASPSLSVYFRLLNDDDDAHLLPNATRSDAIAALETLALKRASSLFVSENGRRSLSIANGGDSADPGRDGQRQELLEAFRRLFRSALCSQVDGTGLRSGGAGRAGAGAGTGTKRGIEILHLARRAGRGEERWENEVQEVWKEVCESVAEAEAEKADHDDDDSHQGEGEEGSSTSEADSEVSQ